ncbi:MAG: hypothetical protein DME09_22860 [Candidatus Rokuibacteriota bacterium]|nr:MAG: hypothetical protein DME09_22860 [Candidatus Rokubacteria bacterium]
MMRGDLPALTETGRDGGPQQRARSHGAFARRRLVAWRESIDPTFLYRCAGGILLTLGVTGVGTPATTTAQSSQLIAAYAFDEGSGTVTADASGNGHVGTLLNGPTWTTGKYGGALSFNGLSSAVSAGNPASLNNVNTFTYCAWVFPRSRGGQNDARILHKGTPTARKQLQTDSSLTNSLKLRVDRATASAEALSVANTMSLNQWQFVCGTYSEADGARVYKNGVEVTYTSRTVGSGATVDDSAATLYIGNRGDLARGWDGLIDEVRVYGGILTPAEIQTAMTTPLGGGSSDTIPPTAPATLTATAGGPGQIDLAWTAATDNVGVTAYLVERCQGSPCSFAQVATVAGLAYSDTGLAAATSYSYQVRATDAAGNLGPYSPVASATTSTDTAAQTGSWSSVLSWSLVAVHTMLLPTGDVLMFDRRDYGGAGPQLWSPATGAFTSVPNTTTDVFCSSHTALADGRILVTGGDHTDNVGIRDTNIFDSRTRSWSLVAPMSYARWYPTATTLPDGRVLATSGSDNCDACLVPIHEVYNPGTNTWIQLTQARMTLPQYPFMFVLPDGRVLVAGSWEATVVAQALDVAASTWTTIDPNAVDGGTAVMYLPGEVMKSGTSMLNNEAVVSPVWQQTASMAFPRAHHNLTLLPDGTVLVTGGGLTTAKVGASQAVYNAEVWSPATKTWTTLAKMQTPRLYHSIALLLPDGRVLIAGGGRTSSGTAADDQLSAEIYSPPYLFRGPRPVIASAPTTAPYGGTVFVGTPDALKVASVSLVRLGSVTHSFNNSQRFLSLPFQQGVGGLNVQAPATANLAPPGYYMLFLINTNGVPSLAAFVRLS